MDVFDQYGWDDQGIAIMSKWQCPRCGATSREETDRMCKATPGRVAPKDYWCPGFVAVELEEFPDGSTCQGYVQTFKPDSKAMYDALVRAK